MCKLLDIEDKEAGLATYSLILQSHDLKLAVFLSFYRLLGFLIQFY